MEFGEEDRGLGMVMHKKQKHSKKCGETAQNDKLSLYCDHDNKITIVSRNKLQY